MKLQVTRLRLLCEGARNRQVLDGSGPARLGQKAADYLTAQGFNVVKIAPAERSDYRSSLVQVLTADRRAAPCCR